MIADLFVASTCLLAQAADAANAPQAPGWTMLVYGVIFVAMIYFMMIRPQQQAKKQQDELISNTKTGDKAITTGGILGTIANVKEKTVVLKIADNVKIEVLKTHLASVTKPDATTES